MASTLPLLRALPVLLEANLPYFDLLAAGRKTARRYADLRRELKTVATPIPSNDAWIAASTPAYRK
jgi:predicted nucleic acid-binding protein